MRSIRAVDASQPVPPGRLIVSLLLKRAPDPVARSFDEKAHLRPGTSASAARSPWRRLTYLALPILARARGNIGPFIASALAAVSQTLPPGTSPGSASTVPATCRARSVSSSSNSLRQVEAVRPGRWSRGPGSRSDGRPARRNPRTRTARRCPAVTSLEEPADGAWCSAFLPASGSVSVTRRDTGLNSGPATVGSCPPSSASGRQASPRRTTMIGLTSSSLMKWNQPHSGSPDVRRWVNLGCLFTQSVHHALVGGARRACARS
jgi:hypothetical protein